MAQQDSHENSPSPACFEGTEVAKLATETDSEWLSLVVPTSVPEVSGDYIAKLIIRLI